MSQSDLEPSGFKVWRRSALRQVQICVAQTLFEPLQIIGFTCYEMNQFGFYLEVGDFVWNVSTSCLARSILPDKANALISDR